MDLDGERQFRPVASLLPRRWEISEWESQMNFPSPAAIVTL